MNADVGIQFISRRFIIRHRVDLLIPNNLEACVLFWLVVSRTLMICFLLNCSRDFISLDKNFMSEAKGGIVRAGGRLSGVMF